MIIAGVEEAGRGPVIGPLVMAICTIEAKDEKKLFVEGVKDSKVLNPIQREKIVSIITNMVIDYQIVIISAEDVDSALNNPSMNLNLLEAKTTSELIDKVKCDKVIIDCPAHNTKAYADTIKKQLKNKDVEVVAEHKADANYTIVAAASILAKVTRDREIEKLKEKFGVDFGSGYPADPKTVKFLEENFDNDKYKGLFRESWESYKRLINKKNQKSLFDY
ncbi:ribonuclease HII [Candidatus Woesearchaeota archaeon]|nr:ribonuclease HII [Candidatus Woesearchaeota archaeon]